MESLDQINTRARFIATGLILKLDNVLTLERVRIALESAYLSGYAACNAARLADLQLRQVEVEART